MKQTCATLFFALLLSVLAVPVTAPIPAAAVDAEQELVRLDMQLTQDQAKLDGLKNQVEQAAGVVDALNRKLAEDQKRETVLDKQVSALARNQYERPAISISTLLDATTLQQLISNFTPA